MNKRGVDKDNTFVTLVVQLIDSETHRRFYCRGQVTLSDIGTLSGLSGMDRDEREHHVNNRATSREAKVLRKIFTYHLMHDGTLGERQGFNGDYFYDLDFKNALFEPVYFVTFKN